MSSSVIICPIQYSPGVPVRFLYIISNPCCLSLFLSIYSSLAATKKRKVWKSERCPTWWPVEIAFRSPSAAPKFSVAHLDTILEAFEDHLANIGAADGAGGDDTAGDRDRGEMQSRDEHVEEQGEEVNMQ